MSKIRLPLNYPKNCNVLKGSAELTTVLLRTISITGTCAIHPEFWDYKKQEGIELTDIWVFRNC